MKKTLLSIALLLLLVLVTGASFAYWDQLQKTEADQTVALGEGSTVVVNAVATPEEGKKLVPANVMMGPNDVTSVTLTYNVHLTKAAASARTFTVTAANVEINNSNVNAGLVNIDITKASETVNTDDVLVTVVVTLTEPDTEAEYNAIVNQPITFDLLFSVQK